MKHFKKIIALGLGLLSIELANSSLARAEGGYLGALIGVGSAAGTAVNLDSGFVVGGTVGYLLTPNFGVAATYQHTALSTSLGDISAGVHQWMAEANFFTFFLLQGGVHFGSVITNLGNTSSTDFGFGAHVGIDIKVLENWSVGGQIYYTYVTQENDKHSLYNFVVPIKYWF